MTRLIGIDIGGSKTHAALFEHGLVLQEALAGSANVQNVTPVQAAEALHEIFGQLPAGTTDLIIAGAGGIDTKTDESALREIIQEQAPGIPIRVVHDSRLILAAGGHQTGIAVIAGTGSAAWGRNDANREARVGGWGHLLGDEGSGYWLGREAVRHTLQHMNQGLEPDALSHALLGSTNNTHPNELISMFHSSAHGRHYWAQQARCVVDCASHGDPVSTALLVQAGQDLAHLAIKAAHQLGITGPVILGGGLGVNIPALQTAFQDALTRHGIGPVRVLRQPPVFGAPLLTKKTTREPAS